MIIIFGYCSLLNEDFQFKPINLLTNLILCERLSDDDVVKCIVTFKSLDSMERNSGALPVPTNFHYTTKIMMPKAKR